MGFVLNSKFNRKAVILVFAGIASLFAILTSFLSQLGFILLPILASSLAVVYLLEKHGQGRRLVSIILPICYIIFDLLLNGIYSINCLCAVIVSLILYIYFERRKITRTECGAIATAVIAIVLVLLLLLACFYAVGDFDFGKARDFVENELSVAKDEFLKQVELLNGSGVSGEIVIDTESASELFDLSINMSLSVIVIFSFAIAGLCLKFFRFLVGYLSEDRTVVYADRFNPSSVFAYFYLLLSLVTLFIGDVDGVVSIALMNLYYIFMFVFAYLGYSSLTSLIRPKVGKGVGILISVAIVLVTITSLSLGVQLLATFGVLFNIFINKKLASRNNSGDEDRKE